MKITTRNQTYQMSACCGYSFICFLEEGIQVWLFSLRKNRISLCTKCFLQIPEAGIQHQEKQQITFRGNFKILLLALKIKVNFVLKTTYQIKILMQVLFTSKKKKKNCWKFSGYSHTVIRPLYILCTCLLFPSLPHPHLQRVYKQGDVFILSHYVFLQVLEASHNSNNF